MILHEDIWPKWPETWVDFIVLLSQIKETAITHDVPADNRFTALDLEAKFNINLQEPQACNPRRAFGSVNVFTERRKTQLHLRYPRHPKVDKWIKEIRGDPTGGKCNLCLSKG